MKNIEKRGMLAAEKYLDLRGYEVAEVDQDNSMIVAIDEDAMVIAFVKVCTRLADEKGIRDPQYTREGFERYAIGWLNSYSEGVGYMLRPDTISLTVIGGERAMVKHHINCFE